MIVMFCYAYARSTCYLHVERTFYRKSKLILTSSTFYLLKVSVLESGTMAAAFVRAAETCESETVREVIGPLFPHRSDPNVALARPEAGDPAPRSDCATEVIDCDVYTHGREAGDPAHGGTPNQSLKYPHGSTNTSRLASASGADLIHIGPTPGEFLPVQIPVRDKNTCVDSSEPRGTYVFSNSAVRESDIFATSPVNNTQVYAAPMREHRSVCTGALGGSPVPLKSRANAANPNPQPQHCDTSLSCIVFDYCRVFYYTVQVTAL